MTLAIVRASYGARASEYVDALGGMASVAEPDVALVGTWARGIEGPVLDVGSGPGHWTQHLSDLGVDIAGVDPVPEFIELARAAFPAQRYSLGQAEALGVDDGSLGGVLAWYSLIHIDPERIGHALAECARCIRPGGGLAMGFFTGIALQPFEHAITRAYAWPIHLLASAVEAAGFTVTHTESRTERPGREHGAILADRL